MAKDPNDPFDDLFEPFDPGERRPQQIPPRTTGEVPVVTDPAAPGVEGTHVYCASCGSPNHAANRHCEMCGARIARSQTPVAPQPMLRTTAGARALVVLSSIVLSVAVLALVMNVFGGGGDDVTSTTATADTTVVTLPIGELVPIRVDCTSFLSGFPCSALIDDDPENRWNATNQGIDAELTFLFSPKVQITEMLLVNVKDDERFTRNARIKGLEITIDDLTQATIVEVDDTNAEPIRIQIRSLGTSSLTIKITSAYIGTSFEGKEPFTELALQQVQFFGRTAPEASG